MLQTDEPTVSVRLIFTVFISVSGNLGCILSDGELYFIDMRRFDLLFFLAIISLFMALGLSLWSPAALLGNQATVIEGNAGGDSEMVAVIVSTAVPDNRPIRNTIPAPTPHPPTETAQPAAGSGIEIVEATAAPTAEPTLVPTQVPPTAIPPTDVPPTAVPPTEVPPTALPSTDVPSTEGAVTEWLNVNSWAYQLSTYTNNNLDELAQSNFDLLVVDLARDGYGSFFSAEEIAAVQATDKFVLAYFEIGAIESFRPEWEWVPQDLHLGAVSGWPDEQYVKYWDERWWSVVQSRVDQALASGYDGAYLDMIVTYEEISAESANTNREDLAAKMVALIARLSAYAKSQNPNFKIVPQNSPELQLIPGYLEAVDGLGMEEMYFMAIDLPCVFDWCEYNRQNASAVRAANKLVLSIDYADSAENVSSAYTQARAAGFVPYVADLDLNNLRINANWDP